MPELSIHDIEQISSDIILQDVNFSHLLDDLIDHVCCDVEDEMSKGCNFKEAYQRVKLKMAPGSFREIQKETLFAVDNKYRIMKSTMKISGIAGTLAFGTAALFKIQHWPGSAVMMTLGAILLALVFLPSALGVLWKETHSKGRMFLMVSAFLTGLFFICGTLFKTLHWPLAGTMLSLWVFSSIVLLVPSSLIVLFRDPEKARMRPVYVIASLGFLTFVTGFLFKIQHWPAATILIITGTILIGFVALPAYTVMTWKEESSINSRFLFLIIGLVLIVVPGTLINRNLQNSYDSGYYANQKSQIALYDFLVKHNSAFEGTVNDPAKLSLIQRVNASTGELLAIIGSVQAGMVREAEGTPGKPVPGAEQVKLTGTGAQITYNFLSNPFTSSPVNTFLVPGCNSRKDIETGLEKYLGSMKEIIPEKELRHFAGLLEISNFLPQNYPEKGITLFSGLFSLELLRNSILATQSGICNIIINN